MNTLKIYLSGLLAILYFAGFGQSSVEIEEMANKAFQQENYYTAAIYYKKLVDLYEGNSISANNASYPYQYVQSNKAALSFEAYKKHMRKLADSYRLYSDFTDAEKYYAKAVSLEEEKSTSTIYYYGKVLRANKKYKEAIVEFDKVENSNDDFKQSADFERKCCRFALEETIHPCVAFVEKVDTQNVDIQGSSDYGALLSLDENGDTNMLFTTTRFTMPDKSGRGFKYKNELLSYTDGEVGKDRVLNLNEDVNSAAATLSKNGKLMFVVIWSVDAKDNPEKYKICRVTRNEKSWSDPEPLPETVNKPKSENLYPSVSADGRKLFFSSNRKGGEGGFDIYEVDLDKNGWPVSQASNLGSAINTPKDEKTPFFYQPQNILYFSSEGYIGMGGLDIFSARWTGEEWTAPENLGYPINSANDDVYPYISYFDSGEGFITSDRANDCCYDLFSFKKGYYHARGIVVEQNTKVSVPNASIDVKDSATGRVLKTMQTDSMGRYNFALRLNEHYKVRASAPDFLDGKIFYDTPAQVDHPDTVDLPPIEMIPLRLGQPVVLKNIFYDFDKATLRPESKYELNLLLEELLKHPDLVVEIGSHTDSKGTMAYNLDLSQRRSQSVVDYLVDHGLPERNITAKGYGESRPIASNKKPDGSDNPDGRQLNRRTEFKVISKGERYISEISKGE